MVDVHIWVRLWSVWLLSAVPGGAFFQKLQPPIEPNAKLPKDAVSLFFLGPGSTGTRTAVQLAQATLPWAGSCHDLCLEKPQSKEALQIIKNDVSKAGRWDWASQSEDKAFFAGWRARNNTVIFADHGQLSQWRWIETNIANARFVLLERNLAAWTVSRSPHTCDADQIAKRADTCVIKLREVIVQAAVHATCVKAHFAEKERRSKFVVANVCDEPADAALAKLRWVVAPAERQALLPTPKAFPEGLSAAVPPSKTIGSHTHPADQLAVAAMALRPCCKIKPPWNDTATGVTCPETVTTNWTKCAEALRATVSEHFLSHYGTCDPARSGAKSAASMRKDAHPSPRDGKRHVQLEKKLGSKSPSR